MEFQILGPLEVRIDGRNVDIGGARQRALLAVLLLHPNRVVSTDQLLDALWGEQAPGTGTKALQVYVSRLRKTLGQDRILTKAPGYELRVEPGELDVDRVRALIDQRKPEEALALWRGPPLADFAYEAFAQTEVARLEELRLGVLEERIDMELARGRHGLLAGELEALVREYPLRERFVWQLMLALYRSGRQAEALEAYQRARQHAVEELGIEPGPALRKLERQILNQDDALGAPASPAEREMRISPLVYAGAALLVAALVATAVILARRSDAGLTSVPVNSVGVVDLDTSKIVAAIPIGGPPGPVVAGAGAVWTLTDDGKLLVKIDPEERRATTYGLDGPASSLAADADTVWLLQEVSGSGRVARFNARVDAIVDDPLPTGHDFNAEDRLAVGKLGVWITHTQATRGPGHDVLIRVDAHPGKKPREADVGQAVALAMDASAIWVLHERSQVDRIDPRSGEREGVIHLGRGWSPQSIAIGLGAVWVAAASVVDCPASSGPGISCPTGKPGRLFRIDPVVWVGATD